MRPSVFLPLNLAGTIGRLWLIRALGETFEPSTGSSTSSGTIGCPSTALAIAIVVGSIWRDPRSGETEIESLALPARRAASGTRTQGG